MNYVKILLLSVVAMIFLNSCQQEQKSPILSEVITKENVAKLPGKISEDKLFSREEIDLFSTSLARMVMNKDTIIGKTVADLIAIESDLQRNNSMTNLSGSLARFEILQNHKFKYVGLLPKDDTEQPMDIIVYELTNTSEKEIKNVAGALQFRNPVNQAVIKYYNINSADLLNNQTIKPGETKKLAYPYKHDNSNVRDSIMRISKNLHALWTPSSIEYSDGSVIKLPEEKK